MVGTALGPGRYYVVVDGPTSADNGPFDIQLDCEPILSQPSGSILNVGSGAGCNLQFDFDRFADGRGVWSNGTWVQNQADRSFARVSFQSGISAPLALTGSHSCVRRPGLVPSKSGAARRSAAQTNRGPKHILSSVIARLPEVVLQHRHVTVIARSIVFGCEQASDVRLHAEHLGRSCRQPIRPRRPDRAHRSRDLPSWWPVPSGR